MPDILFSTGHDLVDQLRAYRVKVGLTQDDIAWKLGFSATTVSRWERGMAMPDLRATGAIVDFLRRADAQTERRLLASILASGESRNLWEGRDIRYLGGSQQEYRESPEMRAVVRTSIRRSLTGHYRDCLEDEALISGLYAREIASIEDVDKTWRISTGSPMGPFQIYDIVGMMTPYMLNKDSDDPEMKAFADKIKSDFIDKGYLGTSTGRGFNTYG